MRLLRGRVFDRAHTQTSVVVYVTTEEKEEIRKFAKMVGKSMSGYLLDFHKEHVSKDLWKKGVKCI